MKIPSYSELTDSQRNIANLPPVKNYVVTGEPGTGKTVIALYMAKQFVEQGKSVLFLIHNRPLKQFIESQLFGEEFGFEVNTIHAWINSFYPKATGKQVPASGMYQYKWDKVKEGFSVVGPQYDYIIFDEAQDFSLDVFDALSEVTEYLACYMDPNQNLAADSAEVSDLNNLLGIRNEYTLQDNFRNSKEIFEFANLYSKGPRVADTGISGEKPYFICVPGFPEQNAAIINIVNAYPEAKTIAVIANTQALDNTYKAINGQFPDREVFLYKSNSREFKDLDYSKEGVYVMAYNCVKGLEFDVVINTNVSYIRKTGNESDNLFYVACTRARSLLYCLYFGSAGENKSDGCIDVFGPIEKNGAGDLVDWSLDWNLETDDSEKKEENKPVVTVHKKVRVPASELIEEFNTWQDSYQAFISMRNKKTGTYDYNSLIGISNQTIRLGLSYQEDSEAYLSVIKFLAAMYNQTGQYYRVLNELNLLIDLQNDVPAWVYHNYIDAEIHIEDKVKRILRKPDAFFADLNRHNPDADEEFLAQRQINILTEFFRNSAKYISENKDCLVNYELLEENASVYKVNETPEFVAFERAVKGEYPDTEYNSEEIEKYKQWFSEETEKNKKLSSVNDDLLKEKEKITDRYQNLEQEKTLIEDQLRLKTEELNRKIEELERINKELDNRQEELDEKTRLLAEKQESFDALLRSQSEEYSTKEKHLLETLNVKVQEIEKKDQKIQEIFEEKKVLRKKIETLEEENKKASILPPYLMVAKTLRPVTEILYAWVKKNFPDMEDQNNRDEFWFGKFSHPNYYPCFDFETLQKEGIHHLEQFDLYKLLKMITDLYNWHYLKDQGIVEYEDFDYFKMMQDVRNNYAHFKKDDLTKDHMVDLKKIKMFLEKIRVRSELRYELSEYIRNC